MFISSQNKNLGRGILPIIFAFFILLFPVVSKASVTNLMPKPKLVEQGKGFFPLGKNVALNDATDCFMLKQFLSEAGCTVTAGNAKLTVNVELVGSIPSARDYELAGFPDEAYRLEITKKSISIKAVTATGVTRAASTLMLLAEDEKGKLPCLTITDWPAFKLRGYMHDVGRSFISVDELKHEIDLLARFKVNVFHWHLTENQAWRFEVKAFPQLTSAESMTRLPGKFYTQEECREVVSYAMERGMFVIPEIDMPGHSKAFARAMGFDMQTDEGVAVLKKIVDEVIDVFRGAPYIHIGADEQRITYPRFLETFISYLHDRGQRVIVWNPIHGVKITKELGADMTQMWGTAGRAVEGVPNIDCRYFYANHFDVFADLVGIYKTNIYYSNEGSPTLPGAIVGIWNDRNMPTERDIILQNSFWTSVLAVNERAWMGGGQQYIETGGVPLPNDGPEYDEFCDFERRLLHHKDGILKNEPIPYVRQTDIRWQVSFDDTSFNNARVMTGAGIYLRHVWGKNVHAILDEPEYGLTAYARTFVYSPVEQDAHALIEFQNYSRSERDLAPDLGHWDRKGSQIFLNDEEILPPAWKNAGKEIDNEAMLLDENLTARPPQKIHLKKGWNKVNVILPWQQAPGVRLNKWLWTFVITTPDGNHALPGLRYSAEPQE